jgi:hypothetical protein
VLLIFESMMSTFEHARQRYLPTETLNSQRSQHANTQSSAPSSPLATPPPRPLRTTRSSQGIPIPRTSAPTDSPTSQNELAVSKEQMSESDDAEDDEMLESQKHFSTNINLGWQKMDNYFNKTDATPIYRAAVVLHPRLKWRWFEKYWAKKPQWLKAARKAVDTLWEQYRHTPAYDDEYTDLTSPLTLIRDEWTPLDEQNEQIDQLKAYLAEGFAQISVDQSPIPYWISKLSVWPQLARMALDIYSTPPCSDDPERVFSEGSALLVPRRRQLGGNHVREILCLRSWQDTGIITLDGALFEQAIKQADGAPIDDDLHYNTYEGDDEVVYHQHDDQ